MNEKKLMKDINKWRKKFNEAAEQLKLAKASYIVYMGNQCPDKIERPTHRNLWDGKATLTSDGALIYHETSVPSYIKEAFNE